MRCSRSLVFVVWISNNARALTNNKRRRLRFKAKCEQRNQETISRQRTACPIPPVPPTEINKHQNLLIGFGDFQTASDVNTVDEKPHFRFPVSSGPLLERSPPRSGSAPSNQPNEKFASPAERRFRSESKQHGESPIMSPANNAGVGVSAAKDEANVSPH